VLTLLQDKRYIGEWKEVKVSGGNAVNITLIGAINKCGVVKPRFAVKVGNYRKYEKRYLPARGFGILIVSTSKGLLTHTEAQDKKLGGKLIAYCY
jgi:small subunit ribosomal protein S8